MFEFVDFSPFVDFFSSGDTAALAVGGVLVAAYLGLKLAGKKVPVLDKAADALTRAVKVFKPKPQLKEAPPPPSGGADEVLGEPAKLPDESK